MKKIRSVILGAILLSMTTTSVIAHDNRWGVDSNRRQSYRSERGTDAGTVAAIGIGALLLGTIIGNSRRDDRYIEPRPYYPTNNQVCETIETLDRFGYILNRRTICYYPR